MQICIMQICIINFIAIQRIVLRWTNLRFVGTYNPEDCVTVSRTSSSLDIQSRGLCYGLLKIKVS